MDASAVFSTDTLDIEHAANFDKPWLFEAGDNLRFFDTEDEACAAQRAYRAANGFDPLTGEPV
jgi:allophanate hydrolase subunit 1